MKRFTQLLLLGALVGFGALLTACPVEEVETRVNLYPASSAPPATTAEINSDYETPTGTLRISQGIALAVYCSASCQNGCQGATLQVNPPERLTIHNTYSINGSARQGYFLLVGEGKGTGTLTVTTPCQEQAPASRTYAITVEPAPTLTANP